MTYSSPQKVSNSTYSGSISANLTGDLSGALIAIDFKLRFEGVANLPQNPDELGDLNFQSFLDHVATWEGFTIPVGGEYNSIDQNPLVGGKEYIERQEVTPTE